MRTIAKLSSMVFLSSLILMLSCSRPTTMITASWVDPELSNKSYKNVLVTALIEDMEARLEIESKIANELREQGVVVSTGMGEFPADLSEENQTNKEKLITYVDEKNIDGLLTVSLIDQDTETRYIPGNYAYAPASRFSYYGNFWGYYNFWYPQVYRPGYYTTDNFYFLETNLYDAASEELVWSAQSETVNPATLESFSEKFSEKITKRMVEKELIPSNSSSGAD